MYKKIIIILCKIIIITLLDIKYIVMLNQVECQIHFNLIKQLTPLIKAQVIYISPKLINLNECDNRQITVLEYIYLFIIII